MSSVVTICDRYWIVMMSTDTGAWSMVMSPHEEYQVDVSTSGLWSGVTSLILIAANSK